MADPLDKQLVEAVLARPPRSKAELAEARLASIRPSRGRAAAPVLEPEPAVEDARRRSDRRRSA